MTHSSLAPPLHNALRSAYRRLEVTAQRLFPPDTANVARNRKVWNRYARAWGGDRPPGEEWGSPSAIDAIAEEWLYPYTGDQVNALEIGVGAGRIARRIAPRVRHLTATDLSREMLVYAGRELARYNNLQLVHVDVPVVPLGDSTVEFAYSFDVFVHLDLHTQARYFSEISRVLRPEGHAFIHTSNLASEEGWRAFASQSRFTVENFYWVAPETVQILAERSGFVVDRSSGSRDGAPSHADSLFTVLVKPPSHESQGSDG